MKIYIAGKLWEESERKQIEKVADLCESLGFETFVPHRNIGLVKDIKDVPRIFKGDITNGFSDIDIVVALLDGLHIGAGTAWELGYAYAKGIPAIGLKTDADPNDCLEELSAILIGSMKIVTSMEELKKELEMRIKIK